MHHQIQQKGDRVQSTHSMLQGNVVESGPAQLSIPYTLQFQGFIIHQGQGVGMLFLEWQKVHVSSTTEFSRVFGLTSFPITRLTSVEVHNLVIGMRNTSVR